MKTGIDVLDKLTGYDAVTRSDAGHIWLLRGPPGSGKTTLALQILANHLKAPGACAGFLSLEVSPSIALDQAKNKSPELNLAAFTGVNNYPARLICVPPEELEEAIRHGPWTQVSRHLTFFRERFRGHSNLLIIIDSINVLAAIVRTKAQAKAGFFDLRMVLGNLCQKIKEDLANANVILTSEHHPSALIQPDTLPESFSCDVEIILQNEALTGTASGALAGLTGVGYAVERLAPKSDTLGFQTVEMRSFCRVIKSRNTACQARRCAYDIVSGKGMVFFETYPGDGHVLLFAENVPQQEAWDAFFDTDVPQLYPALRYGTFGRSALQRTFATQRRFKNVPERTDMFLASFDSYWIKWYTDFHERWHLYNHLTKHFERSDAKCPPGLCADIHRCVQMQADASYPKLAPSSARKRGIKYAAKLSVKYSIPYRVIHSLTHASRIENGLLQTIPEARLKLFGERNSALIHELRWSRRDLRTGSWLSVPYNANIGFIAYRKDLLEKVTQQLTKDVFTEQMDRLYTLQSQAISECMDSYAGCESTPGFPKADLAIDELYNALARGEPPQTWEELFVLCSQPPQSAFLIETQTYDSYMATFLEFLWSVGGESITLAPDYHFQPTDEWAARHIFEALFLLRQFFQNGIVPLNSTLDPAAFGAQFSKDRPATRHPPGRWMFARHWYSTLVDVLTARKPHGRRRFHWTPDETVLRLGIMPIPISLRKRICQGKRAQHISCWGDWQLAVLKGSENQALAIDLINNLMSAQKVSERAFSCAALPTVNEFYDMYGQVRCFNVPNRSPHMLPQISFAELRRNLFRQARSRDQLFDYAHCARELHSILDLTHHTSRTVQPLRFATVLRDKITAVLKRIHRFGDLELLVP